MIWIDGVIQAEDQSTIPLGDRIFEHGLGLFETFRAWQGKAPLLDRHLARLRRSAMDLGIDLDGLKLPDPSAVDQLTRANNLPESMIRLTVSAGRPEKVRPTAWIATSVLPADPPSTGYRVVDAPWPVALEDRLARHKTLNYWAKRLAHDHARSLGADEAIIGSPDGRFWEGSRTNLFLIRGDKLISPPLTGPIVPGILRGLTFEQAGSVGLTCFETDLTDSDLSDADEIFLTNSVRGLIPVQSWAGRSYQPVAPDFPAVSRLRQVIDPIWNPMGLTS